MKFLFYILAVVYLFTSCSSAGKPEEEIKTTDTLLNIPTHYADPKVDVKIALLNDNLVFGDEVVLKITLTNTGSTTQKVLFDKPKISTGGPWGTSVTVIDKKTNKSVLKLENITVLSSQIYFEEQLKFCYYNLAPNQSLSKNDGLTSMVAINDTANNLPKGNYTLQLHYWHNVSNSLDIQVK